MIFLSNESLSGNIRLDRFLKWAGVSSTGGQGKIMILSGMVKVNGVKTGSRGKKLSPGDVVSVEGVGNFLVEYNSWKKL